MCIDSYRHTVTVFVGMWKALFSHKDRGRDEDGRKEAVSDACHQAVKVSRSPLSLSLDLSLVLSCSHSFSPVSLAVWVMVLAVREATPRHSARSVTIAKGKRGRAAHDGTGGAADLSVPAGRRRFIICDIDFREEG